MLRTYRNIKSNGNGYISAWIIYLLLHEVKLKWRIFKFLRLFVWQPLLCLKLPPSSFTIESLLTLRIVHPFMIIINGNSKIGEHCSIYHDVTLGAVDTKSPKAPQIGKNVYLGCKCSVLGDIIVGDNTMVGAHALVLKSTPPNSTITGLYK